MDLKNRDVLIITIDCLRDDRTSPNHKRNTTPYISETLNYTPSIAAAPWTYSSVPSILTGLYPHNHGAVFEDNSRDQQIPKNGIRSDVYTLPELLSQSGYDTYFSTSIANAHIPLQGRIEEINIKHGADAESILTDFRTWWEEHSTGKIAYLQLGDLHEPLDQDKSLEYGPNPESAPDGISRWRYRKSQGPGFEAFRSARLNLYDSLVHYVDSEIGSLLNDISDETLVFITSDHGEEHWEWADIERKRFEDPRGYYGVGHGHALVPEVIEVPIFTNIDVVPGLTSTTDIAATVLSEIGGTNYLPKLDGVHLNDTREVAISEGTAYGDEQTAVVSSDYHYIESSNGSTLLIDRNSGETVAELNLERSLAEHVSHEKRYGTSIRIDDETRERLNDLGYT